jgi:hypothetical protein
LPFKKTSITSKGDISISSNKEKVVYWDKTFKVHTEHMRGVLLYQKDGREPQPVPQDAFVAFVRLRTGARIGVVTVTTQGQFELNLPDEYRFEWKDDPIDFYYKHSDGTTYSYVYKDQNGEIKNLDLSTLYDLLEKGQQIILTSGSTI